MNATILGPYHAFAFESPRSHVKFAANRRPPVDQNRQLVNRTPLSPGMELMLMAYPQRSSLCCTSAISHAANVQKHPSCFHGRLKTSQAVMVAPYSSSLAAAS